MVQFHIAVKLQDRKNAGIPCKGYLPGDCIITKNYALMVGNIIINSQHYPEYFLLLTVNQTLKFFMFFFASPKKNQKKSPAKDYIPFAGGFPDQAFVLL
jgi:hypothetical protein